MVLTWYFHPHTDSINLKQRIFLIRDMGNTVKYKWCVPPSRWNWQTVHPPLIHIHTRVCVIYCHLNVLNQFTPVHGLSQDRMFPVYITREVPHPPIYRHSPWFTVVLSWLREHRHWSDSSFQSSSTLKWVRSTYSQRSPGTRIIYWNGFRAQPHKLPPHNRQPLKVFLFEWEKMVEMSSQWVIVHWVS